MSSDYFYHQQWAVFATNTSHLEVLYKIDTWFLVVGSICRWNALCIWSV